MQAQDARDYRRRWQAVAAIEEAERRRASLDERLRQLNSLLGMARALGMDLTRLEADEHIVYRRWAQLKRSEP